MEREDFKRIHNQAKERFENYTTLENLLFISDLLEMESEKLKEEKQEKIGFDLIHLSFKIADLINEIF